MLSSLLLSTVVTFLLRNFKVVCDEDIGLNSNQSRAESAPLSSIDDLIFINNNHEWPSQLVRLLTDAEYRHRRNRALSLNSPPINWPKESVDSIEDRVHVHHLFPPSLVRPLQRLIVKKLIHYIKYDPEKEFKKKLKAKARKGMLALGLLASVSDVFETASAMKTYKSAAKWHVNGFEDLSAKKRHSDDGVDDDQKKDFGYPKEAVKQSGQEWPFHSDVDLIHEKWNKFPLPTDPPMIKDPVLLKDKIKQFHSTLHELHPTLRHIINDFHTLFGHKKLVVHRPEHPIKEAAHSAFNLIKFAEKLIPSIRIRIPLIDDMIKSKKKVIYIKSPPTLQYVHIPKYDTKVWPLKNSYVHDSDVSGEYGSAFASNSMNAFNYRQNSDIIDPDIKNHDLKQT